MTLTFLRNKIVKVEPLADGNLSVCRRLADPLAESEIRTVFRLPDLEILSAEGRILRSPHSECVQAIPMLQKAVGIRVGPGVRKIVHARGNGTFVQSVLRKYYNGSANPLTSPERRSPSSRDTRDYPSEACLQSYAKVAEELVWPDQPHNRLKSLARSLKAPPLHLYPETSRNPAVKSPKQTQDLVLKFPDLKFP